MKCSLLLFFGCMIAQFAIAQNSDPRNYQPPATPETNYYKQQITDQVLKQLDKIDWGHTERNTSSGTILYTIPVIVHVLHNYGPELIADSTVNKMISNLNSHFLKTNPDTVNIIDKFKPVAANTQIAFKLATIDPYGNPTKGIEHIFTYLTYNYLGQAEVNQWPPSQYLNIWITESGDVYGINAYNASYYPYYDGITLNYNFLWFYRPFGEYLNLSYPCSCCGYNVCQDADGIPDTPPCEGDYYDCTMIYDTVCDTPNVQNIMINYDTCGIMFTYGQGQYMQNVLQLDFGNRDSLVTPYNFSATGMDQPVPDMLPVADFSIWVPYVPFTQPPPYNRFYCESQNIRFKNQSWNDTITAASWAFSNNADVPASTSLTMVNNKFHQPGWVTVSLAVTGNNTGTTVRTDSNALFIADSIPVSAMNYVQEFAPGPGMDKWPLFNYYNNAFKWQIAGTGCYDNISMEYISFDVRSFPQNQTGGPEGDVDDIFTPAFDLTGFSDSCYLNFMSSGATIANDSHNMTDSMEIEYSVNQAQTWNKLVVLKGNELANKGNLAAYYWPAGISDWVAHAILLPHAALTAYTIFRFRYSPGADSTGISSGNNFYLDHFNFNVFPESIHNVEGVNAGVSLLPNPAHGNTWLIIKDKSPILTVSMVVTDITGKVVYTLSGNYNTTAARIEIPEAVLGAKGLYLVHVITNSINQTQKLVVY